MAQLIPVGTTEETSAPFTITISTPASLWIKPGPGGEGIPYGADFWLQKQSSGGDWYNVAVIRKNNLLANNTVAGLGTFRVRRQAGTVAAGMDIEQAGA